MDRPPSIAVISLDCPDRAFLPSASIIRRHCGWNAMRLFGLSAESSPDARPWLDHNLGRALSHWGSHRRIAEGDAVPFPRRRGDGLHQIAVGPVHAGIIEPGHFRFTASGETVVRLERHGYVHKGIDGLMTGASLTRGVQLAGRTSGDSTVAYAYAFSRAAEVALDLAVPDRAVLLRALLAELERLARPPRRHRRHLQRCILH